MEHFSSFIQLSREKQAVGINHVVCSPRTDFPSEMFGFGSFDRSLAFKVLHTKLSRAKEIKMHRYKKGKRPVVLTELLEANFLWLFRGKV